MLAETIRQQQHTHIKMKFVRNAGTDRVVDVLQSQLAPGVRLDVLTPSFSLSAHEALRAHWEQMASVRIVVPAGEGDSGLLGNEADRSARNRLQMPFLAWQLAQWLRVKADIRCAVGPVPQGLIVIRNALGEPVQALQGAFGLSTDGLGITPGNPLGFVQVSETAAEAAMLAQWFESQWAALPPSRQGQVPLLAQLDAWAEPRDPMSIYASVLHQLFRSDGEALDEDRIVKAATGIRNTVIWKKLYKFQRDGVVGAIDKLERFGGCIVADSVGLGKTFEALAVIKYHELRNDRVLVLAPKRLRDNWSLYKSNDQRNVLAADRLNYDLLNHTDLSREGGMSGDIDLAHINWGNYDLVVIDESHNFRNKRSPRHDNETRYDRLMRKIIREGVKTRVLMLSATPVNNRLADLRNQIAFATEGDDTALFEHGIASIEVTTRRAQTAFNRWLELPEEHKTPQRLIEMLGFDYFSLLDKLTIARSRRHIEKYYGTGETGRFPSRLPPINLKERVDTTGAFPSMAHINLEIRRLKLASLAPLRYVLPQKLPAYDAKYSTQVRGGDGIFRQVDREESLIHLMRVNLLKRMESSVASFAQTVERLLRGVDDTLARLQAYQTRSGGLDEAFEEIDIADVDVDDPAFEALLVGRKIKVLLRDLDALRWRQDLTEDRNRLATLHAAASHVDAEHDAKLARLRTLLADKVRNPTNAGNRKVIIFTAFADTAEYLYAHMAGWVEQHLGLHTALVTGSGHNRTTLGGLRKDLASILTAFSPRSKERPASLAQEGELDVLIATDCISEGQNLQDCDWLINYDIHWNPVRIIQRFGRIDRIGSPNASIQLVNFWPDMELEEYINLEQRVSGRMVLLDISATGEENLIEQQSGDPMNDLEYRRKQLLKLQNAVIDLEDLSSGVSITDLTLTDFRLDLARYLKAHPGRLEAMPAGVCAVTSTADALELPPGILFCLQAQGAAAGRGLDPSYPLAPVYLVHVGERGEVLLPYTQAKHVLDRFKRLCMGRELPDAAAVARHAKATRHGEHMAQAQMQLAAAVASVVGKSEERAVASLFSPGGTHAMQGEFAGMNDFEVLAYLVIRSME